MAISGHKSVQSLAVYQRTDQAKKLSMGKTLTECLTPKQKQKMILGPPEKEALPSPQELLQITQATENAVAVKENVMSENALVPFEPNFEEHDNIPDFDLLSAICDIEEPKEENKKDTLITQNSAIQPTVANTCTSNVVNQIPRSFFANCQIGTINVNIIKK